MARAPQFEEALTLCTIDPGAVAAARLRDPRHRTAVRRERGAPGADRGDRWPPWPPSRVRARSAARSRACSSRRRRSTARCARACATTRTRTASSGWCSGCPAGSTRRWWPCSPSTRSVPDRVTCVSMPSPYSSEGTQSDARGDRREPGRGAGRAGHRDAAMRAYDRVAGARRSPARDSGLAEENLQARIRGNLVMALSNKFGWLVLTTGNKSELSVGYATLYGDMAGGFAVLKDVFKGWVYRLVRWRNAQADGRARSPPPRSTGRLRPSCAPTSSTRTRCRPTRCSTRSSRPTWSRTSTPPRSWRPGHPAGQVERVIGMVDRAEYKRRQAPPGIRISTKAFGRDRRLPITNRYETRAEPHAPQAARPGLAA